MSLVDDTVLTIHIRGDAAGLTPALTEAKAGLAGLTVEADALSGRGKTTATALENLAGKTSGVTSETEKAVTSSGKLEKAVGRVGAAAGEASGAGGLGSMLRTLTGLSPEALGFLTPLLAVGGGLIVAAKSASNFEDTLLGVANNTGQSTAQMEQMRQAVLKLGADSNQSLSTIAAGFEKAANAGFQGAAAYTIVQQAMKAAAETGSDLASTVDATTGVLKQFSLPAAEAGRVLGVLMTAAAQGDVRLPDLVTNFSKVGTLAGAMNMSLSETAAAFSTLTRFTHSASTAQTDLAGALQHILTPTKTTTTLIDQLSKSSGVDLVKAFHDVSTGAISLTTFLGDVRAATNGNKAAQDALFGGMRGGLAGVILLNQGWKDYGTIADKTANSTGLVNDQFKRTSDTLSYQMGILHNKLNILFIDIGTDLLPSLKNLTVELGKLSDWMIGHQKDVEAFGTALAHDTTATNNLRDAATRTTDTWSKFGATIDKATSSSDKSGKSITVVTGLMNLLTGALDLNTKDMQFQLGILDGMISDFDRLGSAIKGALSPLGDWLGLIGKGIGLGALGGGIGSLDPNKWKQQVISGKLPAGTGSSANSDVADLLMHAAATKGDTTVTQQHTDTVGKSTVQLSQHASALATLAKAEANLQSVQSLVTTETQKYGGVLPQTEAALKAAQTRVDDLSKSLGLTTTASAKATASATKLAASTDTLTKLTDQRAKLEVQVQADIAAGLPIPKQLQDRITSLSGEITHIQGVISGLENPVKARIAAEKAAELQAGSWTKSLAAAQNAATKAQNEYLYDKDVLHLHGQALQDAYTKMVAANVALNTLQGDATAAGNALGVIAGAGKIQNIPGLPNTGITSGQNLGYGGTPGTSAANALWVRGVAGSPYAAPAQFSGLPAGALGNGGFGGQSGGGGVTVGGDRFGIPTTAQIKGMPPTVTGAITSIVGAPGTSAVPLPVSVVDVSSAGLNSLRTGTPVQAGQPTTVELKALQQLQSTMSAHGAVDSAKLTVLADTSKMNVDATNATTNAVQDQTSVLQAQAAVGTARSNATIAAINDETAVMSAQGQYAIDSLKSSQTIAADLKKYGPGAQVGLDVHLAAAIAKVDQDNIAIAKAKETQDRALGLLSIKISEDGLKAAQDKAKADEVAAKFTQLTDKDTIAIAKDNLLVNQDTQQIQLASLGQLVQLNVGQDNFSGLIAKLGADNSQLGIDTWQLGGDQSASDASAALWGGTLAGDNQQTAIDQNAYATTQGAGDTRVAYLNQTQSQDSTQVSLLQQAVSGISQVASNTSNGGDLVAAIKTVFDAISAMTQTGGIGGNAGQGLTFAGLLDAVGQAVSVGMGQSFGSVAITRNP